MHATRKLNPHDRSRRNAEIVDARSDGDSWATIARCFGVSARQARRIVRDLGSAGVAHTSRVDPMAAIEAGLLRYEALVEQLAGIADTTQSPMVAVTAIRAQVRATDRQLELLQNVGVLPTPLSNLAQQVELQRIARRAAGASLLLRQRERR